LVGTAGHYQQLLLAIYESCKLEPVFFSCISRNYRRKLFAECLFFPVSVEVNQPYHINQAGARGVFLLVAEQCSIKEKYWMGINLEAVGVALH
jgi:hypothetical protein